MAAKAKHQTRRSSRRTPKPKPVRLNVKQAALRQRIVGALRSAPDPLQYHTIAELALMVFPTVTVESVQEIIQVITFGQGSQKIFDPGWKVTVSPTEGKPYIAGDEMHPEVRRPAELTLEPCYRLL